MRNKWILSGVGIVLVGVLIAGFALVLQRGHATAASPAASHATGLPNPYHCANADVPGVPSLTPTGTGPVAFTEQDVRTQLMQRVQDVKNKAHIKIDYTIKDVWFMTSLQACTMMGGVETGRPLDAMVILVASQSSILTGPSAGLKTKSTSIYDAHTGNSLGGSGWWPKN